MGNWYFTTRSGSDGNGVGGVYARAVCLIDGCTIDGGGAYGVRAIYPAVTVSNSLIFNTSTAIGGTSTTVDGLQLINTIIGGYATKYANGTPMEINVADLGSSADGDDFGFTDAGANDYTLTADSPAVAAGWPASWRTWPSESPAR